MLFVNIVIPQIYNSRGFSSDIQLVAWTFYLVKSLGGDMGVDFSCFGTFVSQQAVDITQVGSVFKQMRARHQVANECQSGSTLGWFL